MQFQVCESGFLSRGTDTRVVVQEHHGAPLLNSSGLVLVRQLIERLAGVGAAALQVVPGIGSYPDPDLQHVQWREQAAGRQSAGPRTEASAGERPDTARDDDRRFGNDQQDKQRHGLAELRDTTAAIQQDAFVLPRSGANAGLGLVDP